MRTDFNRDESRRTSPRCGASDFTIRRPDLIDSNGVSSRTIMADRFDKTFAFTPIGALDKRPAVRWELINVFRYTDEGRLAEEWVRRTRTTSCVSSAD
jgi:hypothetical protein